MDSSSEHTPTKYYIDFENVHGPGLKGVDVLDERDEVFVFYSQAAETFHIEQAIDIMKSKARIEFVEIDSGTRNSLDFQLVAALFGTMTEGYEYAIVSGDGGFDAAIRMGERLELPRVRRITDLTGSTESPQPKSTRQRRSRQSRQKDKKEQAGQTDHNGKENEPEHSGQEAAPVQQKLPAAKEPQQLPAPREAASDAQPQDSEAKPAEKTTGRKRRSTRKSSAKKGEAQENEAAVLDAQAQAQNVEQAAEQDGKQAAEQNSKRTESEPESASEELASATAASDASEAPVADEAASHDLSAEGDSGRDEMASAEGEHGQEEASATDGADEKEPGSAHARSGRYSKRKEVKALLAENGVTLNQQQLSSVMKALNGVKNKQGFYRSIIQAERQERGLELYRQVRDHYEAMVEILRS